MTEGTILIGKTDDDMVEFLKYVRSNGGECICSDYQNKTIQVIRGTVKDEEETVRFCADGILGVVDTEHVSPGEETEQAGRRELLQGDEGNVLQLGYVEDLRTR